MPLVTFCGSPLWRSGSDGKLNGLFVLASTFPLVCVCTLPLCEHCNIFVLHWLRASFLFTFSFRSFRSPLAYTPFTESSYTSLTFMRERKKNSFGYISRFESSRSDFNVSSLDTTSKKTFLKEELNIYTRAQTRRLIEIMKPAVLHNTKHYLMVNTKKKRSGSLLDRSYTTPKEAGSQIRFANYVYLQRYSGQSLSLPSMRTCRAFCAVLLNATAPQVCQRQRQKRRRLLQDTRCNQTASVSINKENLC